MLALRIVMPSHGDAELLQQVGGSIDLEPIFFGNEAVGPHLQLVELAADSEEGTYKVTKVLTRTRIKIKSDGKLTLMQSTEA